MLQAVEDYHRQVSSVANQLLDEFRSLFGEEIDSGDFEATHQAMEERKKKLMYELTVSGKHFAFKVSFFAVREPFKKSPTRSFIHSSQSV